jgi:NOL1/NOP2/fmu family ribosome biogenesis protein
MALDRDAFPSMNVDLKTALSYLHRDAILLPDAPKGYMLVCYEDLPLGFVKNLGNRCNSLHPQGRRIRMDVSTIGDNI